MPPQRLSAVLCSTDLTRSQHFYEEMVGLALSAETIPNHLLFECRDGTTLLVYGRPGPNKADHTQVRFWTDDVGRDVEELAGRGVVFEDYDFETLKTANHVATTPRGRQVGVVQGPGRKHARAVPTGVAEGRDRRDDGARHGSRSHYRVQPRREPAPLKRSGPCRKDS